VSFPYSSLSLLSFDLGLILVMRYSRFSLPATLLEPVVRSRFPLLIPSPSSNVTSHLQPNLEYWTYLDRADLWANIPDHDDPLDRMLAVLRFTLTKELKYVKGKVCKPYNSVLVSPSFLLRDLDGMVTDL
jgi:hypothetical protein